MSWLKDVASLAGAVALAFFYTVFSYDEDDENA